MTESRLSESTRQILEDHAQLRRFCGDLRGFLTKPRPEIGEEGFHRWSSELSQRLVELHGLLFRHFRLEEEEGGLERIAVNHPEAAPRLDELCAEHPSMLAEVRALGAMTLQYSEGKAPEDTALRRRLTELLDLLARHESDETALIQHLEYQEIGVGD